MRYSYDRVRGNTDFANLGITSDEIPDFLITALLQGKIVGCQGIKETRREIYEVIFKEKNYYVANCH